MHGGVGGGGCCFVPPATPSPGSIFFDRAPPLSESLKQAMYCHVIRMNPWMCLQKWNVSKILQFCPEVLNTETDTICRFLWPPMTKRKWIASFREITLGFVSLRSSLNLSLHIICAIHKMEKVLPPCCGSFYVWFKFYFPFLGGMVMYDKYI